MDKIEKCRPFGGNFDTRANIKKYKELSRKNAEAKAKKIAQEAISADIIKNAKAKVNDSVQFKRITLEAYKRNAVNQITKLMPIAIMTEAFSTIVAKSLVHDADYVAEQMSSLKAFTFLYLYNLGGMKYLKEQCDITGSSYLRKLYKICREDATGPTTDKIAAIRDAKTINDVKNQLNFEVSPVDQNKIGNDIGALAPDEVGELVKDKVLTAINDESVKQEKDEEFRKELSDKKAEYEGNDETAPTETDASDAADNEPAGDSMKPADGEETAKPKEEVQQDQAAQEQPASTEPPVTGEEDAEDVSKENVNLCRYLLRKDIHKLYEHSMLFAVTNSVYKSMLKPVKESETMVLASPLNFNMNEVYADNINGDLKDLNLCQLAKDEPIVGHHTAPNEEEVLAEALLQYTFLEAASTIKLITPTRKEIKEYIKASMK